MVIMSVCRLLRQFEINVLTNISRLTFKYVLNLKTWKFLTLYIESPTFPKIDVFTKHFSKIIFQNCYFWRRLWIGKRKVKTIWFNDIWAFMWKLWTKIFCCRRGSQRGGRCRGSGEASVRDQPEQSGRSDKARALVSSSILEAFLHVSKIKPGDQDSWSIDDRLVLTSY